MKRIIFGAALACALAVSPAHAGILYDFVLSSHEAGANFVGVRVQVGLTDAAANQPSVYFHQDHRGGSLHVNEGGGVDLFGLSATPNSLFIGSSLGNRMPIERERLEVSLVALLGGGIGGFIKYGSDVEGLNMAYDASIGSWRGQFAADNNHCLVNGDVWCDFTGTFVQVVPEPAGLALLAVAAPVLMLRRRRR